MMTANLAALPLDSREGLPDNLAYLRRRYPRTEWRGHVNFGQLSAFWLQTHDTLREHGKQLGKATAAFREGQWDARGFQGFFVPRLNHFLQHLNGHHQIEDQAYFPKFRALDARMVAGFDLLEADHSHIHDALLASADSGRNLAMALAQGGNAARRSADRYAGTADQLLALLLRHLSDEEDLVVPAMLHHGERLVG